MHFRPIPSYVLALAATFLLGFSTAAVSVDLPDVQKNQVDLQNSKFFARPITELELILINLRAQSQKAASFFDDIELHILKRPAPPEGDAGFDPRSGRIILLLTLYVSDMSDPWRETCASTLERFYGWFYLPTKDKGLDNDTRLRILGRIFGEATRLDADNAKGAIDVFLNSIATRVIFYVAQKSELKWISYLHKR